MPDSKTDECEASTATMPMLSVLSSTPPQEQQQQQQAIVRDCIALLHAQAIRCVAFDMDFTAVARHSRGRLRRDCLQHEYLDYAVPPFVALVPALHAAGIHVAITTHSDEAEFDSNNNNNNNNNGGIRHSTHILGHELVQALLQRHVPDPDVRRDILIVAYNPRVREESHDYPHKRFHMHRVRQHFADLDENHEDAAPQILLLDDTAAVVRDCRQHCHVRAIQVSQPETYALQWSDIFRLGTSAERAEY